MAGAIELLQWTQRMQWRRGIRALVTVGTLMVVSHLLGRSPLAAALGAFNCLLVDNGGPYRTRLTTMAVALLGGTLALVAGSLLSANLLVVIFVTLAVCFAVTYARVVSQPIASTAVLILVVYFAGLGGSLHTLTAARITAEMVLLGGVWTMLISLLLWPIDPFRPARLAVATCYVSLADFTASLTSADKHAGNAEAAMRAAHDWQRNQRTRMEEARSALSVTGARAPSRTVRARNLTVLLETADMLMARTMRLTELLEAGTSPENLQASIRDLSQWLASAEQAIGHALTRKPADAAASFAPEGSHRMQFLTARRKRAVPVPAPPVNPLVSHLQAEESDTALELGIAFDAIRAIWTGSDVTGTTTQLNEETTNKIWDLYFIDSTWLDSLRANWTLHSANMRHALRLMIVGAVDVTVMRLIHINHGFWLPMTSIILMQPYSAGTNRKSVQRVTGTIAGGILAALLAVSLPGQLSLILVITILAAFTLATFAVDYAVYCFFLTPTFVLLSLPHPHDWRYAGIRIGTTLAGATIAILAMRLLWPERAETELAHLLRRGAQADAAYMRAMLRFWSATSKDRRIAERTLLAPARRACGLASNDAEEAVDRVLQEPSFTSRTHNSLGEQALTFTTYLRRLTQSITTLALFVRDTPANLARLETVVNRLDRIANSEALIEERVADFNSARPVLVDVAEDQIQRMERQSFVLERTAAALPRT
jgi:uncharacterized membrane protein YccC